MRNAPILQHTRRKYLENAKKEETIGQHANLVLKWRKNKRITQLRMERLPVTLAGNTEKYYIGGG